MLSVKNCILTIASEESCHTFRVRVWFIINVKIRVKGKFSSGAIILEPLKTSIKNDSVNTLCSTTAKSLAIMNHEAEKKENA